MHEHVKERYYVPSMIVRATEVFRISMVAREVLGGLLGYCARPDESWGKDIARHQLETALRRYVLRQVGMAA